MHRQSFSLLLLLLSLLLALVASSLPGARPLAAQNCSDEAQLIEQTLDPTSGVVAPDATFTVSWTLENSGDCTWSRTYRLVFVDGERMDSPRTARLRSQVEPGERLTLTLDLTAPNAVDSYNGSWQLRNPDGDNFGPELTVAIQVGEDEGTTTDVVLPEVLVFGGMGAGEDPNILYYCVEDGALPASSTLVVDGEGLEYRYASLYLCSLPEGAEVTVEVTDPEGNTFSRSYVEDAAVVGADDEGNEYTGTVMQVNLVWLTQAPDGEWLVTVTGQLVNTEGANTEGINEEVMNAEATINVTTIVAESVLDEPQYPQIDNWPTTPIDPFAAAAGCHYNYTPSQEMMIGGAYLPANTTLQFGFYQDRLNNGYLVDQVTIDTDAEGNFTIPYTASREPGNYNIVLLQDVNPEGFSEDGTYDFGFGGGDTAFSCFTVVLEEEAEIPWRLALASGTLGQSKVLVLDLNTGIGYYPTFTNDNCDASEPAWWPDGEWVLYQSNCIKDESSGFLDMSAAEDYDLYATLIDPTYTLPEEETRLRLTETPDIHETEPDANLNGVIVYRQTPVGSSLDASGELWLLDIFEETNSQLGLIGRAPTWSPDGERIAFMSDVEGSWQIYVYDVVAEEFWLVSEECATQCRLPAWSPDGKQLVYHLSASLQDLTPTALWITSVEGSAKPRRYLEGEYGRPTWSDEGWIAFQGPGGIYRATPGRRPVAERYLYSDPETATHWAPDWSH